MSHHRGFFSGATPLANDGPERDGRQNGSRHIGKNARVLMVSEDQVIATGLASVLSKNGFDAVTAFDGAAALRLAGTHRFDILVTDLEVTPFDGVRIATVFRNINPASQVFLLTRAYDVARQMLIDANLAWDFRILLKPVDPAQLVEVLRNAWSHGANLSQ